MSKEKKMVEVGIITEYFPSEYEIDSLIEMLQEKKESIGADSVYICTEIDRCGDNDGLSISYYRHRIETDEEYSIRVEKEKKRREEENRENEKREIEKEKRIQKGIEDEKFKLLELMEKYPELLKK